MQNLENRQNQKFFSISWFFDSLEKLWWNSFENWCKCIVCGKQSCQKNCSRNWHNINNNYTVIQIWILYILIQICYKSDEISNTRTWQTRFHILLVLIMMYVIWKKSKNWYLCSFAPNSGGLTHLSNFLYKILL